jgi:prepilin-type N-terminal cleavage/methylation domain-containing protein
MINHQPVSNTKGFTLIETIIYLALFSILFTGVLVSAYSFFRGAEILSRDIVRENEVAFVTRKIAVLLNSADTLIVPAVGTASSTLQFSTYDGLTHTFLIDSGKVLYATGTNARVPLNTERVVFSAFTATHTAPTGDVPRFIEYGVGADGEVVGPLRTYFTF